MKKIFILLFLAAAVLLCAADFKINVTSSSKTGWVKAGEVVTVKASVFCDGKPISADYKLQVRLWKDGSRVKTIVLPAEKGYAAKLSLDKPGWSMVIFTLLDSKNKRVEIGKRKFVTAGSGIVLDPYTLKPGRPEPKDFDLFWNAGKAELAGTPLKVIERKKVSISAKVDKYVACYDMKIACAGPRPVSGYLSIPLNKSRKYPAVLSVDGAGVRSSGRSVYADRIAFNINAHGILNGQPPKYYSDLAAGELYQYPRTGGADRNKIYFRYMFLRVLRALEYLKTLPEWNGKDLIVRGGSQGGAQTLFAAAMDKDVTLAVASVSAMCDFGGCLAVPVRQSGWPRPYRANGNAALKAAWDYYDCVNFARRITCPIYITTGLIDWTCVPTSVFAMYNQLKSKNKHMETHRDMGHAGLNIAGNAAIRKAVQKAAEKR